jgi:hypothetical protein
MTLREWIELDADRFESRATLEAFESYLLETAALLSDAGIQSKGALALLNADETPRFFRLAFDMIRVIREGKS